MLLGVINNRSIPSLVTDSKTQQLLRSIYDNSTKKKFRELINNKLNELAKNTGTKNVDWVQIRLAFILYAYIIITIQICLGTVDSNDSKFKDLIAAMKNAINSEGISAQPIDDKNLTAVLLQCMQVEAELKGS